MSTFFNCDSRLSILEPTVEAVAPPGSSLPPPACCFRVMWPRKDAWILVAAWHSSVQRTKTTTISSCDYVISSPLRNDRLICRWNDWCFSFFPEPHPHGTFETSEMTLFLRSEFYAVHSIILRREIIIIYIENMSKKKRKRKKIDLIRILHFELNTFHMAVI